MCRRGVDRRLSLEGPERVDALVEGREPFGHHLEECLVVGVGTVEACIVDAALPGAFQAFPREGEIPAKGGGAGEVKRVSRVGVIEIRLGKSLEVLSWRTPPQDIRDQVQRVDGLQGVGDNGLVVAFEPYAKCGFYVTKLSTIRDVDEFVSAKQGEREVMKPPIRLVGRTLDEKTSDDVLVRCIVDDASIDQEFPWQACADLQANIFARHDLSPDEV